MKKIELQKVLTNVYEAYQWLCKLLAQSIDKQRRKINDSINKNFVNIIQFIKFICYGEIYFDEIVRSYYKVIYQIDILIYERFKELAIVSRDRLATTNFLTINQLFPADNDDRIRLNNTLHILDAHYNLLCNFIYLFDISPDKVPKKLLDSDKILELKCPIPVNIF